MRRKHERPKPIIATNRRDETVVSDEAPVTTILNERTVDERSENELPINDASTNNPPQVAPNFDLIEGDDFPPEFDHDFNAVSSSFQCPSRVYSAQTQRIEPSYQPSPLNSQITQTSRLSSIPTYTTNLAPKGNDALSNKFLPRVVKCEEYQKVLETPDDIKWHYETTYGKEDCKILKSML